MRTTTPPERAGARPWLRAATTPRMVVLLVVVAVLATVFVRLGVWQYERSGIRGEEAARIDREELLAAPAVPIEAVLAPQTGFRTEHFGRRVSLEGSFDSDQQFLVPDRGVDGQAAVLVVTAFHVSGGAHDGAIMPVLRGWLPEADVLGGRLEAGVLPDGAITGPPPPAGRTTIVGMLSDSEAADSRDLPEGLRGGISTAQLVNLWGTPMYGGYLVLETPAQPGGLVAAPSPVEQIDADPNLQSLMYAIEWWAFALFAIAFWLKVLRDDVRDLRRARAGPTLPGAGPDGASPGSDGASLGSHGASPGAGPDGASPGADGASLGSHGASPGAGPDGASPGPGPDGASPWAGPDGASPSAGPDGAVPRVRPDEAAPAPAALPDQRA